MEKNNYNIKLITCIIFFIIISLITIYSTVSLTNNIDNIFIKQIIFYIIGILVLLITYYNKKRIIKYSFFMYIFFNILLLLLLILGVSINGSKCWIIIGPISFQPSEFMKLFLIIVIAKLLAKGQRKTIKKEFFMLLRILFILLIPSILTFLEPDTGVVLIYLIITISMILYHGINKKWYFYLGIILGILTSLIVFLFIYDKNILINFLDQSFFYRIKRVLDWKNQSGYQLDNSIISIGSSGLFGFGINNIPLYYPEASTDFIFTSYSSLFGFIGNVFFIIIIILFDLNILKVINKKTRNVDKYIIIGCLSMILYQQIQNISMTIGLLPITGITLPFISYGGSSLLSYMFILGIILRISNETKKYLN